MVDPSLRTVLERFEVAILSDPSVLGVLYTGSLGRGTADQFSDLDLEVWLAERLVRRPACQDPRPPRGARHDRRVLRRYPGDL